VSDPSDPEPLAFHETSSSIHNAFIDADRVYLTQGESIDIIDVTDDAPVSAGAFKITDFEGNWSDVNFFLRRPHDVWVQNHLAYVPMWEAGTWIVDVSDPANPAVLAELRAEVDRVLGEQPLWSELEQADELSYLGAVLSETLRLRPVAPMQGMTAREDVTLGGRRFPAGTNFLVSMRTLALDEDRYPDARAFRPQRWLEDKPGHFTRQPPYPFGGGKRTCPGMNLAMLEIRSVISMLVRNFDFVPPPHGPPVREKFNFTMRPEHLRMQLRPRAK
jgi:hypothetical protein